MAEASPTIRQRELGQRLRKLRTERGMTVEEVAAKLLCSTAKVSRMETGARKPVLRDVRDLCALYEVSEADAQELMRLTQQAREPGWWTVYDDLKLSPYVGLEQDASAITAYCMYYVHALAQTEEYARTVIKAIAPRIDPAIHQQRVEARMRRQERLDGKNPPRYRLLLDEAVLRRPVGGPALMAAQLNKIIELASSGKATVQIVPFEIGAYSVSDISFTMLEFAESAVSPIVFVEGLASNVYYERPADVARYRESIEHVRDSALSPRDSVQFLTEARNIYSLEQPLGSADE